MGFIFAVEDGNSYIAKMLSGVQGAWLFRTPYTSMQQGGVLMLRGRYLQIPPAPLSIIIVNRQTGYYEYIQAP